MLADGYWDVPAGKVAFVVTSLEMTSAPPMRPTPLSFQIFSPVVGLANVPVPW